MPLRHAVLPDLPALIEVQHAGAVAALAHIFPQDLYPFPRERLYARWAAETVDPGVDVFVIDDDRGRLAGFAATRGDQLLHLGTAVETWGSGLAVAAHHEILERLAGAGVPRARLWVFEENHRARRFYDKLGWSATQRRTRTAFPPHPVLVEYARDLTG